MKATRLLITAHTCRGRATRRRAFTGFATSVIGCGCEAGIERELGPTKHLMADPGISVLIFSMSGKELAKQVERRVGQCVLTCPTTAVFAGIADGEADRARQEPALLRRRLADFQGDRRRALLARAGDGRRIRRAGNDRGRQEPSAAAICCCWARDIEAALVAAEAAVQAMRRCPTSIMPFPGGVVRSGSKVGSKYAALRRIDQRCLLPGPVRGWSTANQRTRPSCVLEIVIDGLTEADVGAAMRVGMQAGIEIGAAGGLLRISAGNYGGKLGPFHFHLHQIARRCAAGGLIVSGLRLAGSSRKRPALRVDLRGITPATLAKAVASCADRALPRGLWQCDACALAEFFTIDTQSLSKRVHCKRRRPAAVRWRPVALRSHRLANGRRTHRRRRATRATTWARA